MENKIQWSQRELKERSKMVLRTHYWRIVLVTLLLSVLMHSDYIPLGQMEGKIQNQVDSVLPWGNVTEQSVRPVKIYETIRDQVLEKNCLESAAFGMVGAAAVILVAIASLFGILFTIFVVNPVQVGNMRFLNRSFDTRPRFKEVFHVFEYKYKNVVNIMFLRDLYTLLWTLLFVIPGIVKAYEYRMIPYLLSEHPDMRVKEAFAASRQLMQGQKWKTFVLDLSFLGWTILSGLTFGLLGMFFVCPYKELTNTALYRKLLGGDMIPHNIYYDGMDEEAENGWYQYNKQ